MGADWMGKWQDGLSCKCILCLAVGNYGVLCDLYDEDKH